MKQKRPLTTLAYVRWFDSSMTGVETIRPDDAAGTLNNESAGVLLCEDEKSITIALDRCIETGGVRCTLCIPKVNVLAIRRFNA